MTSIIRFNEDTKPDMAVGDEIIIDLPGTYSGYRKAKIERMTRTLFVTDSNRRFYKETGLEVGSASSWSYATALVPSEWLLDKIKRQDAITLCQGRIRKLSYDRQDTDWIEGLADYLGTMKEKNSEKS